MSFPSIPAGKGVALVDTATGEPPAVLLDYLDERYVRGNTTTDSASLFDGSDDITIWRPPGTPGSVVPTAGGSFTLGTNTLYLRNGFLIGTIVWTRTSGTLTHGDVILTLPVGARPEQQSYAITSGQQVTNAIFPVNVDTNGNVTANEPPASRTNGILRFAMPVPYDYT